MKRYLSKRTDINTIAGRLRAEVVEIHLKNLNHIIFELTERCNLACEYCAYGKYYDFGEVRGREDIPWVYIENTLRYVVSRKEKYSELHIGFYGGEPLLKMDLINKTVGLAEKLCKEKI